ncbi:MAG: tRNA pseudouridine(55) synthase TruB [Acidimicrobiia bacterium]
MSTSKQAMCDGLVVVDKPAGWTSHDVVAKLRGVYGQKRVGHAGTLDPDATGVLLVGLGRGTRLLRYLQEAGKSYRGTIVFGVATSTLDAAGDVLHEQPMPQLDRGQVEATTKHFLGDIEQVPPMVSAIKIGGQRLHELARKGIEVDRPPRPVRIDRFEVEAFEPGDHPVATVVVDCSSGTYIRTLAADMGVALDGCAHLGSLRRLRVGSFSVDESHPLDDVIADPDAARIGLVAMMRDLPQVAADEDQATAASHGKSLPTSAFGDAAAAVDEHGAFALLSTDHATDGPEPTLVAVYERIGATCRPAVVLA